MVPLGRCTTDLVGLIALEALNVLEAKPMPHETINAHNVLPDLFAKNEERGLIARLYSRSGLNLSHERYPECGSRDLIVWNWPKTLELPAMWFSTYESPRHHISEYVNQFCQHTGCLYHLCLPHSQWIIPLRP